MWRVPEKKRRQLNGDEIFTMHAVIKQGARVFSPISLILQSTIKITDHLKHQNASAYSKTSSTLDQALSYMSSISPKSDFSTIHRNRYKT